MAIEAQRSSRVLHPEFKLRLGNRIYPRDLGDAQVPPPQSDLTVELEQALWGALPFVQQSNSGFSDLEELADSYVASVRVLEAAREETNRFLALLSRTNFEFRVEGIGTDEGSPGEGFQQEVSQPEAILTVPSFGIDDALSADLAKHPLKTARNKLHKSLRARTSALASSLFETLDRGVDQQLLGLIDWKTENACVLYFFRRVVIKRTAEKKTVVRERDRKLVAHGRLQITKSVVKESRGEYELRSARLEHHLISAHRLELGSTKVLIPRQIEQLIASVPSMLRPFIEVVEGKRIRERIVEREIDRKTWEKREVREQVRVVSVPDPAIVLGQYVLTGWGEREIKAEMERRAEITRRQTAAEEKERIQRGFRRSVVIAPVLLLAGLLLLGAGVSSSSALFLAGMAVSLVSLVPGLWGLILDAKRIRPTSPERYLAAGSLSVVTAVLGLQFTTVGLAGSSQAASGLAVLLFGLLYFCIRWAARCRDGASPR